MHDEDATTPASAGVDFGSLGLNPVLQETIAQLGYVTPTPIQAAAIPALLRGQDVLGLAATGTGKTAAYSLPLLHQLAACEPAETPRALILVPTRELARQVGQSLSAYSASLSVSALEVYGGTPMRAQLRALQRGVDVVVGTPGRTLDHLLRGTLVLDALSVLVLDEADAMLDMGFQDELEAILEKAPETRQTALFSATFPNRLRDIAARTLTAPETIRVRGGETTRPQITQRAYLVHHTDKPAVLARLLAVEAPEAALVFCQTRDDVDALTRILGEDGHRVEPFHGGLSQMERDRVMHRLHTGAINLVIATDVAARGLDVDRLTHVINVDLPARPESYVHRIGRTGRAGREGVALTLVTPRQRRALQAIERHTKQPITRAKVPTRAQLDAVRMAALAERIRGVTVEDVEPYHALIGAMAGEMTPLEIATAALQLLSAATRSAAAEADITEALPPKRRERRSDGHREDRRRGGNGPMTSIFVGSGRDDRVRPSDLVGAICGETGLSGRAIGAIKIFPRFSLIDVPADAADHVIEVLRGGALRGRRLTVRRDRGPKRHR
ncbi:MAG: DEAD/DEAH box helicase [Myxococcota bacterium]